MNCYKKIFKILCILFSLVPAFAFAGNISNINKMAWGDKIGWVNFGPDNGNVMVTDTRITGYAWSANYGWINLNPDKGGIINDGNGNLSGFAWGDKIGWVNFSGVRIDSLTGVFSGQTTNTLTAGTINFSCDNCLVITEWRKTTSSEGGAAGTSTIIQSHTNFNSSSGSKVFLFTGMNQSVNAVDVIKSYPIYVYNSHIFDFLKSKEKARSYLLAGDYAKSTSLSVIRGGGDIFTYKISNIYTLNPCLKKLGNWLSTLQYQGRSLKMMVLIRLLIWRNCVM